MLSIQWCPTNGRLVLCLCRNRVVKVVNVDTGAIDTLSLDSADTTVAWWHPRQASKIVVGSGQGSGHLHLYNIEKR